jgi:tRNA threonylcarbamoyladenosine modification (KEOPS) complex Cgi121 subunit
MKIYFIKLKKPLDETLKKLEKSRAIIIKPELGYSEKLLNYSHFIAYKSFRKKNHAKTFELEWLSALAGTNNIEKAVKFTKPETKACIVSMKEIKKSVLNEFGAVYREKKDISMLSKAYGLSVERKKIESAIEQKICISKMLD